MSLKNSYLNHSKLNGGPAGWYCPCCNKYGCHPSYMKFLARRLIRIVSKLIIKKEIVNEIA